VIWGKKLFLIIISVSNSGMLTHSSLQIKQNVNGFNQHFSRFFYCGGQAQWLTPVTLASQEVDIQRMVFKASSREGVL
jgi:hypothetical protein